jgi:hypothetical protein
VENGLAVGDEIALRDPAVVGDDRPVVERIPAGFRGSMTFAESFGALNNLATHKLRSALTMLG